MDKSQIPKDSFRITAKDFDFSPISLRFYNPCLEQLWCSVREYKDIVDPKSVILLMLFTIEVSFMIPFVEDAVSGSLFQHLDLWKGGVQLSLLSFHLISITGFVIIALSVVYFPFKHQAGFTLQRSFMLYSVLWIGLLIPTVVSNIRKIDSLFSTGSLIGDCIVLLSGYSFPTASSIATVFLIYLLSILFYWMETYLAVFPYHGAVPVWIAFAFVMKVTNLYGIEKSKRQAFALKVQLMQQAAKIEAEKQNTESILYSILPRDIVPKVIAKQGLSLQNDDDSSFIAENIPHCSVMFARIIQGPEEYTASDKIEMLSTLVSCFDSLSGDYSVEKIKTVGNCILYYCRKRDHAQALMNLSHKMFSHLSQFNKTNNSTFSLRIGIHTGPVMAGVIGIHQPLFDIYGDTVNTASRMETTGRGGMVHMSAETLNVITTKYPMEQVDMIIKGKGPMKTFFIKLVVCKGDISKSWQPASPISLPKDTSLVESFLLLDRNRVIQGFEDSADHIRRDTNPVSLAFHQEKVEAKFKGWFYNDVRTQLMCGAIGMIIFVLCGSTYVIQYHGTPVLYTFLFSLNGILSAAYVLIFQMDYHFTGSRLYKKYIEAFLAFYHVCGYLSVQIVLLLEENWKFPLQTYMWHYYQHLFALRFLCMRLSVFAVIEFLITAIHALCCFATFPSTVAIKISGIAVVACIRSVWVRYYNQYHSMHRFNYQLDLMSKHKQLMQQQSASNNLLLSILPDSIVQILKQNDRITYCREVDQATIVFADLVGFTEWSSKLPAAVVVRILTKLFGSFDVLCRLLGVTKVKTLGDAYVAATNVESELATNEHADRALKLAIEMTIAVYKLNQTSWIKELGIELKMRVGLHTGPVLAGVMRVKRFSFDLWGQVLEISEFIESSGTAGRVIASETTVAQLRDPSEFTVKKAQKLLFNNSLRIKTFDVTLNNDTVL